MVYCIMLGLVCAALFIIMLTTYKLGTPLWILCISYVIMVTVIAYSILNIAFK